MIQAQPVFFADPELLTQLDQASDADLDGLAFGVIGFDAQTLVQRYNEPVRRLGRRGP